MAFCKRFGQYVVDSITKYLEKPRYVVLRQTFWPGRNDQHNVVYTSVFNSIDEAADFLISKLKKHLSCLCDDVENYTFFKEIKPARRSSKKIGVNSWDKLRAELTNPDYFRKHVKPPTIYFNPIGFASDVYSEFLRKENYFIYSIIKI